MKKIVGSRRRRRWGRALVLAALGLAALWAPASWGVDEPPPAVEGPWVIEVGPEVVAIVDVRGDFADFEIVGDADRRLRACRATPGCAALWEDGTGTFVIVDQSPAPASPTSPASPPSSVPGATPR